MSKQITFTDDELHIIEQALRNETTRLEKKADALFDQDKTGRADVVERLAQQAFDTAERIKRARFEVANARFEASIA